jgi:hypothetical protein
MLVQLILTLFNDAVSHGDVCSRESCGDNH